MKKFLLVLLVLMLAAFGLTSCRLDGSDGSYYDSICVNPYNHYRVDYYQCQSHSSWIYYVHAGNSVPRVGGPVTHYKKSNYSKPKNATIKSNGVSTKGGKAPTVKKGPGVSVYKPKNGGGGYKPKNGGYKPKAPAPRR